MKVITLTDEQSKQYITLKQAIVAASAPLQAAQKAVNDFVAELTGPAHAGRFQRVELADDKKSLVLMP